MKEYEEEFGTYPAESEIAEILGVTESMVKLSLESMKLNNILSIDTPIGDADSNRTIGDMIEDVDSPLVDEVLDNERIRSAIVKSLSRLTKREEQVLRLRFGISEVHDLEEFNV
jgi:RNA polymerase primary sigma factor